MTTMNAIYGLRKELGLDDDTARDLYQREVGKRSLRDMTPGEQVRVAQALRLQARRPERAYSQGLTGPYAKKLQALWISGYNLGLIKNRADEALLAYVEKQTKISHTRFLRDASDAKKAVEALKSWLGRGGVDWSVSVDPMVCVMLAQGALLGFDGLDLSDPGATSLDARLAPLAQAWWQWRQDGLGKREERDLTQRLGAEIRRRGDDGHPVG